MGLKIRAGAGLCLVGIAAVWILTYHYHLSVIPGILGSLAMVVMFTLIRRGGQKDP